MEQVQTRYRNINAYMVQKPPEEKIMHALSDTMPMCDLASGVDDVKTIQFGDVCNVYCAQKTCDAAVRYMNEHKNDFKKCKHINYWKQGSIEIDEALLADGQACKEAIREWNATHT